MPEIVKLGDLTLFFWVDENGGPVHVHVSKGKPAPESTKFWLTRAGGCVPRVKRLEVDEA